MRTLSSIVVGSAAVLRRPAYQFIFVGATVSFLALYLLTPVWLVPGTTLAYELAHLTPLPFALLGLLALMTGLLFSLEVFSFKRSRSEELAVAGEGSVGLLASLAGGILAAASCGCGTGILLGVIGLGGGAIFVAEHQTLIVSGMLGVVAIGLYFSARRAAGICATCSV